jgi:hypothetical protein
VSLADAREYVLGDVTDGSQDRKLVRHILAFSQAVITYTGREWLPVTTAATRRFRYLGYGLLSLAPYDLRAVTAIVAYSDWPTSYQVTLAAGTTTVAGDYRLRPFGADPRTGTYRWIELNTTPYSVAPPYLGMALWPYDRHENRGFEIAVTGDWGIGSVPPDVKEAVLIAIDNAVSNPEGAATRTFGDQTVAEIVETSFEGERWRALPGASRALLADYRDDAPVVA